MQGSFSRSSLSLTSRFRVGRRKAEPFDYFQSRAGDISHLIRRLRFCIPHSAVMETVG